MTQDSEIVIPTEPRNKRYKTGSCMPNIDITEEVAIDLRRYIFDLIDKKEWAGRGDREIAGEIINADEDGTENPRFYTLDEDGERKRLTLSTVKMLLRTYRHRSLEVFKDDLMPYIQEAVVEVIKTAGSKPANLKIILDALQIGKGVNDNGHKRTGDTPSPAYLNVCEKIGLEGDVSKRTPTIDKGLRHLGYEDTLRNHPGKQRRPSTGVVSGRDDTSVDEGPNIIEVDGGPYAFTALPSEDDILDYGREYLVDSEEPGCGDSDELGGVETDEERNEHD